MGEKRLPPGQREARFILDLLRGVKAGNLRIGLDGKAVLSMDAAVREVHLDVGVLPDETGLAWMRSAGSLTEAVRGASSVPRIAEELSEMDWTVRVDVEGRELAVLGRASPAMTRHVWISPKPALLADQARRVIRGLFDKPDG